MEKQKPTIPFAERDACTIGEFCVSVGISRSTYYNLTPGDRPREMKIGASKRISRDARESWCRQKEQAAADAAAS